MELPNNTSLKRLRGRGLNTRADRFLFAPPHIGDDGGAVGYQGIDAGGGVGAVGGLGLEQVGERDEAGGEIGEGDFVEAAGVGDGLFGELPGVVGGGEVEPELADEEVELAVEVGAVILGLFDFGADALGPAGGLAPVGERNLDGGEGYGVVAAFPVEVGVAGGGADRNLREGLPYGHTLLQLLSPDLKVEQAGLLHGGDNLVLVAPVGVRGGGQFGD